MKRMERMEKSMKRMERSMTRMERTEKRMKRMEKEIKAQQCLSPVYSSSDALASIRVMIKTA